MDIYPQNKKQKSTYLFSVFLDYLPNLRERKFSKSLKNENSYF